MEVWTESSDNVTICWRLVNEVLPPILGKCNYKFNHQRIMRNEAGANFIGIKEVFCEKQQRRKSKAVSGTLSMILQRRV